MRSFTSFERALAISTSCCFPTPRLVIKVSGFSSSPTVVRSFRVRAKAMSQSITPNLAVLVAEEDIFGDRQERHERQLLMDDDDSEMLTLRYIAELHGLALIDDIARVAAVRIDAAQHFHESRFTGAILAADRVDLAGLNREIHVIQRFDARKRFGDPSHFQDRAHHDPLL